MGGTRGQKKVLPGPWKVQAVGRPWEPGSCTPKGCAEGAWPPCLLTPELWILLVCFNFIFSKCTVKAYGTRLKSERMFRGKQARLSIPAPAAAFPMAPSPVSAEDMHAQTQSSDR